MSKSIYNSLKFLETTEVSGSFHVLHVQNKSQSQQNKLIVVDRSGRNADYDNDLVEAVNYRNPENGKLTKLNESTVYLATRQQGATSTLRAVSVSKLVYDYVTSRMAGVYPAFEALNSSFTDGSMAYELTGDPEASADANGFIRFPVILNIPEADALLALATLDPDALISNPRPVLTVRTDNTPWESLSLNDCLFKTPDGLYWLGIPTAAQHFSEYTQLQYTLRILFKADGDLVETIREATLYSYMVTILAANYDPCENATREVVMEMVDDVPFTVVVSNQDYTFTSLEDFRVNAKARLPANITAKLLNKFNRPEISCAGATSSAFVDAKSTDRFNVYVGETEYKDLTYAEFVALMDDNDCIVKRVGLSTI